MYVKDDLMYRVGGETFNETAENDEAIINAGIDLSHQVSNVVEALHQSGEHDIACLLLMTLIPLKFNVKEMYFTERLTNQKLKEFLNILPRRRSQYIQHKNCGSEDSLKYILQVLTELKSLYKSDKTDVRYLKMIQHVKHHFHEKHRKLIDKISSGWYFDNVSIPIEINELEQLLKTEPSDSPPAETSEQSRQVLLSTDNGDILCKLGLTDYYPAKITLQNVLRKQRGHHDSLQDMPWYLLEKLLMSDYSCRNSMTMPVDHRNDEENKNQTFEDFENFDDILDGQNNEVEKVHPMDILVATFHCMTPFLQQTITEKLYMCRLSFPIIIPDLNKNNSTFLLWNLQNIFSDFNSVKSANASFVTQAYPIVSAVRIGSVSRSKSKLLNNLMGDQEQVHSIFFNRDCDNGSIKRKLCDGLVDISLFIPKESDKRGFDRPITYLNLHGDALSLPKECQALGELSNFILILVDAVTLEKNCTEVANTIKMLSNSKSGFCLIICKQVIHGQNNLFQPSLLREI